MSCNYSQPLSSYFMQQLNLTLGAFLLLLLGECLIIG